MLILQAIFVAQTSHIYNLLMVKKRIIANFDLYDGSVVATSSSKYIDSKLAIDTLKLALSKHKANDNLVLHSDQGSQFCSFDFTTFCEDSKIKQSMSLTGTPGDNAVMERYYNTFKNELIKVYLFETDYDFNLTTKEYSYVRYNHLKPHSYNGKMTPNEARQMYYQETIAKRYNST